MSKQSAALKSKLEEGRVEVLMIGVDTKSLNFVTSNLQNIHFTYVKTSEEFMASFESWTDSMFTAIFVGSDFDDLSTGEIAQTIQNQCPNIKRFYITSETTRFDAKVLVKSGFGGTYILPQDNGIVKKVLSDEIELGVKIQRELKPIKVRDISANKTTDFGVFAFFPHNNRYIQINPAGAAPSPHKIEKIKKNNLHNLYVDKNDMVKFFKYTADQLKGTGLSETEKEIKIRAGVRNLVIDMLDTSITSDFSVGKSMLDRAQGIVSNYISGGKTSKWYDQILNTLGEDTNDTYGHATAVSTFAALFAIGLQLPNPEDLALAGLFHDLSLSDDLDPISVKRLRDIPEDRRNEVSKHPEHSINLVKSKRMILPPLVEKIILQHEEHFDGTGYPKQLIGERICPEAQILLLADLFEYFMRPASNKKRNTPLEVLQKIRFTKFVNPELIDKIETLFKAEE